MSLYSPQGEPLQTFVLPSSTAGHYPQVAYDGKTVVITAGKEILLFSPSGKPLGHFAPLPELNAAWTPFVPTPGRELVLFDGGTTVYRFALPELK